MQREPFGEISSKVTFLNCEMSWITRYIKTFNTQILEIHKCLKSNAAVNFHLNTDKLTLVLWNDFNHFQCFYAVLSKF